MLVVWLQSDWGRASHAFVGPATNARCNTTTLSRCAPLPSLHQPAPCKSCRRLIMLDRENGLRDVIDLPPGAVANFRAAVGG